MSQTQDLQNLTGLLSKYSKSKPKKSDQKLTINLMPKTDEKLVVDESASVSQEDHQENISSSFEDSNKSESFSQQSTYPQSYPNPQTGSMSDDENENQPMDGSETFSQSQDQTSLDIQMPDTLPEIFADRPTPTLVHKPNPNQKSKTSNPNQNSNPTNQHPNIDTNSSNNSSLNIPIPSQIQNGSHISNVPEANTNFSEFSTTPLRAVRKSNLINKDLAKLSVVTYNLWFGEYQLSARTNSLLKSLVSKKSMPDIIGFQEATPLSYSIIRKKLGQFYYLFDTLGDPPVPYANVMAINKSTLDLDEESLVYYDYPETQMGRKLMMCKVIQKRNQAEIFVMNTHLESLKENGPTRAKQMEFIKEIIKAEKIKNTILMGDLNVYSDIEPVENLIKSIGFSDSFQEMGSPQSLKYTYDPQRNKFAQGKYRFRADRILYIFQTPPESELEVVIHNLKLLGITHPYSDHYGVYARFIIKKN